MKTEQELQTENARLRDALTELIASVQLADVEERAKATNEGRMARHHEGSLRKAKEVLRACA